MNKIESFSGEYKWLSNFYPCSVCFSSLWFKNVESAYVAAKTLDVVERCKIQEMSEFPSKVKRYGRTLKLRADWEQVKITIMADLLAQKFEYQSPLGEQLMSTGDAEIIEGNTWGDTYWGVCNGKGKNMLGKLLMAQRAHLLWCDKWYMLQRDLI